MSVRERVEYRVCIFIRKIVYGECPTYLRNRIELVGADGGITSRQRDNIRIKRCRMTGEQKMLLYDEPIMYNNLPREIKREEKSQSFRRALVPYIKSRER